VREQSQWLKLQSNLEGNNFKPGLKGEQRNKHAEK
jgi:hypothetical protein